VRPLPRLHAITDHAVLAAPEYRVRLAAIAAVGPAVALHARDRQVSDRVLTDIATRMLAHAQPPEAATFVNARPDIAAALGAQGVQLGRADLSPRDARKVYPDGWIGASVHSEAEGRQAIDEGADFLVAGSIFPTDTHPDQPAAGLELIDRMAGLGRPVIAIGGITAERAEHVRLAGAYGVAAISALWRAPDAGAAALALLDPWMESDE
jgi:thiamine-phosphate pyrophosphorylase